MASEAKPFASLSSGLLARKGAARPAMRPQGFGQVGNGLEDLGWNDMGFEPPKPSVTARDATHDAFGEDVAEQPRVHALGLTPVQSPVHQQQAKIADRLANEQEEFDETAEPFEVDVDNSADEPAAAAAAAATNQSRSEPVKVPVPAQLRKAAVALVVQQRLAPGTKKAAFTLRLDPDRHLKLRLACAVDGRSAQQIVTSALDAFLERIPELDSLAAKAKPKG